MRKKAGKKQDAVAVEDLFGILTLSQYRNNVRKNTEK